MSEYILILLWLGLAAFISKKVRVQHKITINDTTEYRYNPIWAFLIFLPILLWVGFRPTYFADTGTYRGIFLALPATVSEMIPYLETVTKDEGFIVFSIILKFVLGNNVSLYFLIISAIQSYCLIRVYRKFSANYILSIFLFIASTDYISWMFNGMRQFLAVTIVFACMGLVHNKKYIPAIIIIVLAATIHGSAVLMLPMIFIAQGKAFNKLTMLFSLGVILVVLFLGQFTTILTNLIQDTQYNDIIGNEIWATDNGTNVLRVLMYSIPTIIALWKLRIIREKNDKIANLCVNMSIISTGIYVVSIFTSGIYIGRLPIYFSLYNYILLPWELKYLFVGNNRKLVLFSIIAMYLFFYYYQMHMTWGLF